MSSHPKSSHPESSYINPSYLTLSSAILAGSLLRPQTSDFSIEKDKSCALYAGYEAVFGELPLNNGQAIKKLEGKFDLKGREINGIDWYAFIWEKNDVEGLTREEIASELKQHGF